MIKLILIIIQCLPISSSYPSTWNLRSVKKFTNSSSGIESKLLADA